MSDRPPFVVRSADVSEDEGAYPPPWDAEKLGLARDLGRAAGSRTLGVARERLPPGRRSSVTHAHLREEELVYVLSGAPRLRWVPPGGERQECALAPGDIVVWPAGTGIAHCIVNDGPDDAEYLVVGERRPGERVCYPDDPLFGAWHEEQRPQWAWLDADGPRGDARWPVSRIETPRLVLRPWTLDDVIPLRAAHQRNRDHLLPFMPWAAEDPTVDELADRVAGWQRAWLDGAGEVVLGAFTPDGAIVGGTGLHDRVGALGREIGYWVDARHQGKGYVTEWCAALCRVGFAALELDRLEIHCDPRNVRSAAVPRRLGFREEGVLPRRARGLDGEPADSLVFSLYRSDWPASAGHAVPVRAWDRLARRLV